jgi:hypothetical protein
MSLWFHGVDQGEAFVFEYGGNSDFVEAWK